MKLCYHAVSDWPKLAWVAVCKQQQSEVHIYHGLDVETFDDWYGEIAWADSFAEGNFDQAEVISGSGGRVRDKGLCFVGASSTVDRLNVLRMDEQVLVSNSLPCLLNAAKGRLRSSYSGYNRLMASIMHGLDNYERHLETSVGRVELVYWDNLVWDGQTLSRSEKPDCTPTFSDYDDYFTYLDETMARFAANACDPERERIKYGMVTALSSGYDSATVAAMAARHGGRTAVTIEQGIGGVDDSGVKIANALGMEPITVNRDAWQEAERPEIPVITGGILNSVVFASVIDRIAGNVLMTGYHGDKVWGLEKGDQSDRIVRGDASGLGLGEYRLWHGFLHCPLPFWGCRKVADICQVSNGEEMKPFIVEGRYNRPICRRIVEDAGVDRDDFGIFKKAVELFVWQEKSFLCKDSMADYLRWLKENRWEWIRRFRPPPLRSPRGDAWINNASVIAAHCIRTVSRKAVRILKRVPGLGGLRLRSLVALHPRLMNLRRFYFAWAVDRSIDRYAMFEVPLNAVDESTTEPQANETA